MSGCSLPEADKDGLWLRAMQLGAATGCHQRADRSFFIKGYQLPLCARCLGVGLGQLAAVTKALFSHKKGGRVNASVLICLLPAALDGITQKLGMRESNNPLRLATGLLAGYGYMRFALGLLGALGGRRGGA